MLVVLISCSAVGFTCNLSEFQLFPESYFSLPLPPPPRDYVSVQVMLLVLISCSAMGFTCNLSGFQFFLKNYAELLFLIDLQ